jgi:hypothetical protein
MKRLNHPFRLAHLLTISLLAVLPTAIFADTTTTTPAPPPHKIIVWDGETANTGAGYTNPSSSTLLPETTDAHSGTTALEFKFQGSGVWLGCGWDWFNWKTGDDVGTDTTGMKNLTFWIKSKGATGDLQVQLLCNGVVLDTPEHHSAKVDVLKYCPDLLDGKWHQVEIPLADLTQPAGFNPKIISRIDFGFNADKPANGSFVVDDIGFDDGTTNQ